MTNQDRPAYQPPRALRMGSPQTGAGTCQTNGSGDSADCYMLGNSAGTTCTLSGSGASGSCFADGSSAATNCLSSGSGF